MKFFYIISSLLFIASILLLIFCAAIDDQEVEGLSGATPASDYFISLIPSVIGVLLLIISYKWNKKENNSN